MMGSLDPSDSLYPIAVLIDELRNEDLTLRLNSVKRLETIALALGPERTRSELLPFLEENHDDDDEILLALADVLGKFVPLVGGPQYAQVLLPVLESLATVDETVVRNKASDRLAELGDIMPASSVNDYYIPMVKRLLSKEWTARVSSTQLIACAYTRCENVVRAELRSWFSSLSKDETPMVRRASAQSFPKFIQTVEPEIVHIELMPIFETLTQDEQDSVRLISVESCGALAKTLKGKSVVDEQVVPVLMRFVGDQSWRVRHQAAIQLPVVAESTDSGVVEATLLPGFVSLLHDNEAEVRAAAASNIATLSALLPSDEVSSTIVPCCHDLALDPSHYVRISLAGVAPELAPILGKEKTSEQLLPIFLNMLKDDCADVRLGMIGKLDKVGSVIGVNTLSNNLLPAIEELAKDQHWRVRLAIISHVPLLASQMGPEFLRNQLAPQCMSWLQDRVCAIREAVVEAIKKLAEQFGSDWTTKNLLPEILKTLKNSNYLFRTSSLHALAGLTPHLQKKVSNLELIPIIAQAARGDPIPNVRFNGAKILGELSKSVDASVINSVIRPCLSEMKNDVDPDVRFFSEQALQACP